MTVKRCLTTACEQARRGAAILVVLLFGVAVPRVSLAEPQGEPRSAVASPGQSFLSLDGAIRRGLDHHPLIQQARHESRVARAVTKQTEGERYPWLEASIAGASGSLRIITADGKVIHDRGGHGFDPGGALPKHNQNMITGGLILNQLIADFGQTAHRILASRADQSAAEREILTSKALVILKVQKAYLSCLMQQRLIEAIQSALKRRRALAAMVQSLYKSQLKSKLDLDLVLVQVSESETALVRAENELQKCFATLNNAMGARGSERYELERVPVTRSPLPPLKDLVKKGLEDRPELHGAEDRLSAKEELVRAAEALHFGSITAVGTLGITKYGDVHDGGIPEDGVAPLWGVGATARLPIFTGFNIRNKVKEAGHRRGEAEFEVENIANEVVLQVARAYLAQQSNADQIPLEEERVVISGEALALAQERYRLGLGSIVEVVRSATAVLEAEARLAEAQFLYKMSEATLAYATGRDYQRY